MAISRSNNQAINPAGLKNSYNLRIFLLLLVLTLLIFAIIGRLFALQIVNHNYYQAQAENQRGFSTTINPKRGDIYLTGLNKTPVLVATTVSKNMVYAVPKEINDPASAAAALAGHLGLSTKDLLARISGAGSYSPLAKDLSDEQAKAIQALKVKGIYTQAQEARFYPEKNLASQVIGFLGYQGDDRVGQYGIEGGFNQQLAGTKGSLGAETDSRGRLITVASRNFVPAQNGDDIYLTLDAAIQYKAQEVLAKAVTDHGAERGSVTVINPKTGAILALANYPDIDLNNYGKAPDLSVFTNQVLSGSYEPGSVFKAITLAAALNEGKITPDMTYNNTGSIQVDDKVIRNSNPSDFLGNQSMITVLDESLNTGAVFAQQQLGNDQFKDYVKRFGFGQTVNLGLSNHAGNLDNLSKKGNVFFATASFGQGINATPLQMVQAYSAFANGGTMVQPYLVDKVVKAFGEEQTTKPPAAQSMLDPKTASTISAMLVDAVENGHGKRAGVKGYYIAGKTGTAQVASSTSAGYDPNRNIGSFIGFGPVDDPKFLMLVRIDNPKDVKFAESTAAPAFGQIAQFILNYLQVAPSRQ